MGKLPLCRRYPGARLFGLGILTTVLPPAAIGAGSIPLANRPLTGEVSLQLFQQPARPGPDQLHLSLDLICRSGRWDPEVWGYLPAYNSSQHRGMVTDSAIAADRLQLRIYLQLSRDKWTREGEAAYALRLVRENDQVKGTFSGTVNAGAVAGRVRGVIQPLQEPPPGFMPVKAGEHPRLLFRESDLPALRQKAETPPMAPQSYWAGVSEEPGCPWRRGPF